MYKSTTLLAEEQKALTTASSEPDSHPIITLNPEPSPFVPKREILSPKAYLRDHLNHLGGIRAQSSQNQV